ncbi:plasmid mobilization relaxosome protein MobC [Cohaesibacter celericrescens]|uniref:Plasmid mobilization relaxosome protein MobC n=1 Tax=Cohaesibacter celericrescens TaxID=2067669 RepID=A0A2N5XTC6_9HYPH|nr:plasmid mobilization relaxosome protein MobC [Cohaesibacter celericrescens]
MRCTAAEKETLLARAKAERITASELLRSALGLIKKPTRKRAAPTVDTRLLVALNRIGSNLNQIARTVNAAGHAGDMHQLNAMDIIASLISINRELASLLVFHSTKESEVAD